MILQYDAPIKFSEMVDGHAFILYPDDTHIMKKFTSSPEGETNATGVFEDDPWMHIEDDVVVYPIKRLKAADKEEDLREREQQASQMKESRDAVKDLRSEMQRNVERAFKIRTESLEVLKEISEKLDKLYEVQCQISNNTTWIYTIKKLLEEWYGKLSERLVEIQGVLSKLLFVWTKK